MRLHRTHIDNSLERPRGTTEHLEGWFEDVAIVVYLRPERSPDSVITHTTRINANTLTQSKMLPLVVCSECEHYCHYPIC